MSLREMRDGRGLELSLRWCEFVEHGVSDDAGFGHDLARAVEEFVGFEAAKLRDVEQFI